LVNCVGKELIIPRREGVRPSRLGSDEVKDYIYYSYFEFV